MKLIVEKQGEIVKAIKAEYTPAEALIINNAMRRYTCDEEVNATDREIMEQMLDVKSIFRNIGTESEDALGKIRAEIETKYGQCYICEYFEDYDYEENDISEYSPIGKIADILQIIDKYKVESEDR